MNAETGVVNIRGKQYHTVAKRVDDFRQQHPDYSLTTEIVYCDAECVRMKAIIGDPTGRTIATGHSEEYRQSSQINKTSALENAETSAIGRALAAFGIGGTEFASANEVQNAMHQQEAGGQIQGGAVSPQPRTNHGGRYPTKSALHKGLTAHAEELRRIGDEGCQDDLDAYLTSPEYQDFIEAALERAPHYLEGGDPAPPEFVSCYALETRARDMIALRGGRAAEPVKEEAA